MGVPDQGNSNEGRRPLGRRAGKSKLEALGWHRCMLNRTASAGQPSHFGGQGGAAGIGTAFVVCQRGSLPASLTLSLYGPNLKFNRLSPFCHCCRWITVGRKDRLRLWARLTRNCPSIVFSESKLACALYRSLIDK
jgi:hypothetical protein